MVTDGAVHLIVTDLRHIFWISRPSRFRDEWLNLDAIIIQRFLGSHELRRSSRNFATDDDSMSETCQESRSRQKRIGKKKTPEIESWGVLTRHYQNLDQHMKLKVIRGHLLETISRRSGHHFTNRYWLHEHPGGSSSSKSSTMRDSKKDFDRYTSRCARRWNIRSSDGMVEYVRVKARFFTNSRRSQ